MHTHCLQTGVHSTLLDTHLYSTSHTHCQAIHACIFHNALCIVHAHCQARSVLITHTRTPHAHTHHPTPTVQITVPSIYTHLCTLSCCTHCLYYLHTPYHTLITTSTSTYSVRTHLHAPYHIGTRSLPYSRLPAQCTNTPADATSHTQSSLSHTLCSVPTPSLQTHAL